MFERRHLVFAHPQSLVSLRHVGFKLDAARQHFRESQAVARRRRPLEETREGTGELQQTNRYVADLGFGAAELFTQSDDFAYAVPNVVMLTNYFHPSKNPNIRY